MAIHNQVILYAQVTKPPTITKNDDGEYIRGNLAVTVAPGQRETGMKVRKRNLVKVRFGELPVITENPDMLKIMDGFHVGDVIILKGTLTTKNVLKKKACPVCGKEHRKEGTLTFVHPIHMHIEQKGLSAEEGAEILKHNCEISNLVTIAGTICNTKPEIVISNKHMSMVQFQLAINRKYFIAADNVETRTDYPWVKVYGKDKVDDIILRCKQGTVVLIDGFLQVRKYPELIIDCDDPICSGQIKWNDWTVDLIAYEVEYLNNWKTDEEIAKEKEEEAAKIQSETFGDFASKPNACQI